MTNEEAQETVNVWEALNDQLRLNLDHYRRELKEIDLMLEQSQLEVNKLTQRNASITAHLQQVQAQFDSLPRADIRMSYESALDAQQRLFVMRGQVEKLQNDQNHLKRQIEMIDSVLAAMEGGSPQESGKKSSANMIDTVERMIQAQEAERLRLSRQMHDGPAQALSNFILQTEIAMRLFDMDPNKAKEELSNMKGAAGKTFQKVRDFIFDLRPMMLDDLGLVPTLKRYVDAFKEQNALDVRLQLTGEEKRIEPYQEVMIFRAIQELLNNAARYSQASTVNIQLDMGDNNSKVMVEDNGKGFDIETLDEKSNMGLKIIKERCEMLGGFMEVDSAIGEGARVTFQIPTSVPEMQA
jgi:two-component system, NarL family, sensor histidine kinase DegS